jgi:hypothetical protein
MQLRNRQLACSLPSYAPSGWCAKSNEWQSVTRRTPRQCKQKTIGLPLSPQADGAWRTLKQAKC